MGSSSTVKIVGLLTTLLRAAYWPAPRATGDKRPGPLSARVDAAAIVAPMRRINRLSQGPLAPKPDRAANLPPVDVPVLTQSCAAGGSRLRDGRLKRVTTHRSLGARLISTVAAQHPDEALDMRS